MPQTPYTTQSPVAYKHIVNAGTVLVQAHAGALMSVNVNSVGAASTGTLYDVSAVASIGTATPVLGILSLGTAYAAPANLAMGPQGAGLALNNGLAIITTGTCDLTIGSR